MQKQWGLTNGERKERITKGEWLTGQGYRWQAAVDLWELGTTQARFDLALEALAALPAQQVKQHKPYKQRRQAVLPPDLA